ncbi:IMPACT family protein [Kocuria varians]|uniref:IMPACT family protein n=1 Tax=Kocuria varians TaxID=1272 RepID=UPI0009EEF61F|nr:YigZ family protein [Kocuria varians]
MSSDPLAAQSPAHPVSYTVPRAGTVHSAELEIKKSRFLALLTRVQDEDAARAFIARVTSEHRDARHHCSAFLIGAHREIGRSSDDGEPAGTAGVPMLQALSSYVPQTRGDDAADLSDACAVVVRWFGGIKLGAGGLVRAYSGAVTEALQDAPLVRRVRCRDLALPVPHGDAGRVEAEIRARDLTVLPTEYRAGHAVLHALVPDLPSELDAARAVLASVTSGHGEPTLGEPVWEDIP